MTFETRKTGHAFSAAKPIASSQAMPLSLTCGRGTSKGSADVFDVKRTASLLNGKSSRERLTKTGFFLHPGERKTLTSCLTVCSYT